MMKWIIWRVNIRGKNSRQFGPSHPHTNAIRGPEERIPDPEKCRLTRKGKDLAVPVPQLH